MGKFFFVDVKIYKQGETGATTSKRFLMEEGCRFENQKFSYTMNSNGELSIFDKLKKSETRVNNPNISMNSYQYQVLEAVMNNCKDEKNVIALSQNDINKSMQQYKKGQLVKDINEILDTNYKVQNPKIFSKENKFSAYIKHVKQDLGNVIAFQFGIKTEQNNPIAKKTQVSSASKVSNNITSSTGSAKKSNTEKQTVNYKVQNATLADIPELYKRKMTAIAGVMKITEAQLKALIKNTAKKVGYSEYFIAHLISCENYEPQVKNKGDGTLTGGFGHTKLRDNSLKLGQPVDPKTAFTWLADDIKYFEKKVKSQILDSKSGQTYGDYFNKLPLSMKEGLIDVAFNRDVKKLSSDKGYKSLRVNMQKGYYPSAAVRIRQNFDYSFKQAKKHKFTTGLIERNIYRFLLAIRDFDEKDKEDAKKLFKRDGYYELAIKLKKYKGYHGDVSLMEQAWKSK